MAARRLWGPRNDALRPVERFRAAFHAIRGDKAETLNPSNAAAFMVTRHHRICVDSYAAVVDGVEVLKSCRVHGSFHAIRSYRAFKLHGLRKAVAHTSSNSASPVLTSKAV